MKSYDPQGVISGEGAMTKDLIQVADVDFRNVNVTSIAAVFVIILISFGSASIPVLLVGAIESAIAINMGIPYSVSYTHLRHQHLPGPDQLHHRGAGHGASAGRDHGLLHLPAAPL